MAIQIRRQNDDRFESMNAERRPVTPIEKIVNNRKIFSLVLLGYRNNLTPTGSSAIPIEQ